MSRRLLPEHLEAYNSGIFKNILRAVKEDPELSLEIRMNNEAMVYYRKDKILTTSYKNDITYKIALLSDKYYKDKKTLSFDLTKDKTALRSLSKVRKYFDEAKRLVHAYKMGAEFAAQQNIALGNHSYDHRFLIVDMEWQFSQSEIPVVERVKKTRVDLVIVDTIPNANHKNDIYLTELKVGTGAAEGNSGIKDHVDKTQEIIGKKEAREALLEDVKCIIEQKEALGLIEGKHKELDLDETPKMMILAYSRGGKECEELKKACEKAIIYASENYHTQPMLLEIDGRIIL